MSTQASAAADTTDPAREPKAQQASQDASHGLMASAWLDALLAVARHYSVESSPERVRVEMEWLASDVPLDGLVEHMARQLGLAVVFARFKPNLLDPWRLPLVVDLEGGQVAVIERVGEGGQVSARLSGDQGLVTTLSIDELVPRIKRVLFVKPLASVTDARVDDYIKPYQANWFWRMALRDWPRYIDVVVASLVANVLALGSMLFSMQVYDRVIPAQSEHTLWVLFGGLFIALTFAFMMRVARTHITDLLGKRADLRISDRVFGHALRLRNDARPQSTGSFISQIRELEQVRELITSTTVTAAVDMPFFLLFALVMWYMGGSLVWVPLAAIPLLVIPSLLAQGPLARMAKEGMRETSLRSAMLVEAIQGLDDIKLLRAEPRFQGQWNHANDVAAAIGTRQRFLTGLLVSWTQEVQTLVYAGVVLVGAYQVIAGQLTTGVLIACSIMSSRMIAPLSQLALVGTRWQQAKVALEGLDTLMQRPVDQPPRSQQVSRPALHGDYDLKSAVFRYSKNDPSPIINIEQMRIAHGEKVAILGRNGAGKSTLLQLLSGMQTPQEGHVMLDGFKLSLLDPSDVRRDVALLNQNASLFFGTVRDNITLGLPHAHEDALIRALNLSGAGALVQGLQRGLDHPIMEGGKGLSGGQRQTLLLARTLIREPKVLLLDEPTAWLDDAAERQLIQQLTPWLRHRTLVVATHRPAVLQWVDRIIVLEAGRVVADGPREQLLGASHGVTPVAGSASAPVLGATTGQLVAQAARKDGARPLLGKVSSVIVNPAPVQEGGAA
jgi:ATP-binding cassette, subfamily C, bacterial LapB